MSVTTAAINPATIPLTTAKVGVQIDATEVLDALDTLQESVNALIDLHTDLESKVDELIEKVDNLNLSSSDGLHLEYES